VWQESGGILISLGSAGEYHLSRLALDLESLGSLVTRFFEEDFGNELTSIACFIDPRSVKPLRRLPLLFSGAPRYQRDGLEIPLSSSGRG
jgi:hypothetical protein